MLEYVCSYRARKERHWFRNIVAAAFMATLMQEMDIADS
jgi:hypothetical protein